MSDKTYNFVNYGKQYKGELVDFLAGTLASIKIPDAIDGTSLALKNETFKNSTALRSIDFNRCVVVPDSCCSGCSNLETVTLPQNVADIGVGAFGSCKKAVLTDDLRANYVRGSAFSYFGQNASSGFKYKPIGDSFADSNAFRESKITELDFEGQAGSYAFYNTTSLKKAHLKLKGSLGEYAFSNMTSVDDFSLDPDSDITAINGQSTFGYLGYYRDNPASNIFRWNLMKSRFETVGYLCWQRSRGATFLLPKTVKVISGGAFSSGSDITVYLNSLPVLSETSAFGSITNLSIVVNYDLDAESLKVADKWSTYASYITSGITEFVGELPVYTESTGVALTWYSDKEMTSEVTQASDKNAFYYASKGLEREVWVIRGSYLNATASASDGSAIYDKFVPVGTTVTVTPHPTDPSKDQLFLLVIDGVDCTATGSAVVVADHDIEVTAVYWDGVNYPFHPTLGDNSLSQIKLASQLGIIPASWNLGDEITVKYDDTDYRCRLVDRTGKYKRVSDGSTAFLTFEFVDCLAKDQELFPYNNTTTDLTRSPLFASMNSGAIWDKMDDEFKSVVEDVVIPYNKTLNCKLFLPREHDLFSVRTNSTEADWNYVSAQDEYYQLHDLDSYRIKHNLGASYNTRYWTMSVRSGSYYPFCIVYYDGSSSYTVTSGGPTAGCSMRFAL